MNAGRVWIQMFSLRRVFYVVSMYAGTRAAYNCARKKALPANGSMQIDGAVIRVGGGHDAAVRVHGRSLSRLKRPGTHAGMISVALRPSGLPRWLCRWVRLSSHYGCGHVEIAFYEEHDSVVIFAVRNIARSNLDRMRMSRFLKGSWLARGDAETEVVTQVIGQLNGRGMTTRFADPDQCVKLAIEDSLVHPSRRDHVRESVRRKYRRLVREVMKREAEKAVSVESSSRGRDERNSAA